VAHWKFLRSRRHEVFVDGKDGWRTVARAGDGDRSADSSIGEGIIKATAESGGYSAQANVRLTLSVTVRRGSRGYSGIAIALSVAIGGDIGGGYAGATGTDAMAVLGVARPYTTGAAEAATAAAVAVAGGVSSVHPGSGSAQSVAVLGVASADPDSTGALTVAVVGGRKDVDAVAAAMAPPPAILGARGRHAMAIAAGPAVTILHGVALHAVAG
jgi:hypothetical protein